MTTLPIVLQIYLLAAAVSFGVAGLIRVLVVVLAWGDRARTGARAAAAPETPTGGGARVATPAQVAAIAAALSEVMGNCRIVRIEAAERGHTWVSGARAAQHESHHLARSPGRNANQ